MDLENWNGFQYDIVLLKNISISLKTFSNSLKNILFQYGLILFYSILFFFTSFIITFFFLLFIFLYYAVVGYGLIFLSLDYLVSNHIWSPSLRSVGCRFHANLPSNLTWSYLVFFYHFIFTQYIISFCLFFYLDFIVVGLRRFFFFGGFPLSFSLWSFADNPHFLKTASKRRHSTPF